MKDDVEFTDEQLKALEKALNEELQPVMIKEISENFIPRLFVSELLKDVKLKENTEEYPENSGRGYFLKGVITRLGNGSIFR